MSHAVVYFRLRVCNAARRMPGRAWRIPALSQLPRAKRACVRACVRAVDWCPTCRRYAANLVATEHVPAGRELLAEEAPH
eukprot:14061100-Alexandrium_andersonii.AAC.1